MLHVMPRTLGVYHQNNEITLDHQQVVKENRKNRIMFKVKAHKLYMIQIIETLSLHMSLDRQIRKFINT